MKQKVSKIDYSKAMLPRTRRQQLGDCFKMNYMTILKCGLILLLSFLPLIGFSIFMDLYYVSILEHTTQELEQTQFVFFCLYYSGVVIMCLPIFVGLSGVNYVLRNLIWGEGIFFKSDIALGIKQNAPKNLLFGFISGVIFFAAYFVSSMISGLFISYIPLIIYALIFLPVYFWLMFLNNIYNSKVTTLIGNSFYFYIRNIGWSILGVLMPLSLLTLLFIPLYLVWLKFIVLILFIIFIFPIVLLIMILFTTSKFDEYINQEHYPEHYLKGLNH